MASSTVEKSLEKPLRVALTADGAEFGGAEWSVVNLINHVGTDNIEFVLVGQSLPSVEGIVERSGVKRIEVGELGGSLRRQVAAFRNALATADADLLQATLCYPGACRPAILAAFSMGLPTIAIEQLVRPLPRWAVPIKSAMSRWLVDHVAVGTNSARQVESLFALPADSVRVIHNGVPRESLDDANEAGGLLSDLARPVVGSVGRLEPQKAYDRLVDAAALLEGGSVVIVGDGLDRPMLTGRAEAAGIGERFHLLGWSDQPRRLVRDFDVFVLPSRNEAFPLSIVEAMLEGVPVVASNVGSVGDAVIDGETGLLVDASDPQALARAIRAVTSDPTLANRLAEAARDLALKQFTADSMALSYQAMWRSPRGRLGIAARV